ncbi:hypothetical protein [Paenibacillus endoradicis]|uniref:hypothetical protein n=1 Tax=Paenibacillus endoradicis TaxID=2972487 RepID=UPI002158B46E|nr:hypothetical protein [Paenibacillus endoradicis]MCR8657927.1 hypothetical protein [Paenibacillus endoradicis]
MELQTTCPWCETDIIWDEEIGPEKNCPHCENELSGYRTLEVDLDDEEDIDDERSDQDDVEWDDDDRGILRTTREIAANSSLQSILNEQFEMPECINCRSYMVEAGLQVVGENGQFEAKVSPVNGMPLVNETFKVIWYVCPSCYRTDSYLDLRDRKQLLDALTPEV